MQWKVCLEPRTSSYNININPMEISGMIISRYPALNIFATPLYAVLSTRTETRFHFLIGPIEDGRTRRLTAAR